MSDIRVSVQWTNSTVFAGEEIECTITFKNVSQPRNLRRSPSPCTQLRRHGLSRERWKETLPLRAVQGAAISGNKFCASTPGPSHSNARPHKPALSLSTSSGFPLPQTPHSPDTLSKAPSSENNKHRRSVSIVSIGGDRIDEAQSGVPTMSSGRPVRGHTRAASLQVLPRRTGSSNGGSSSAPGHDRSFTIPSPLFRISSPFAKQRIDTQTALRSWQQTVPGSSNVTPTLSKQSRNSFSSFGFPQGPGSEDKSSGRFPSLSTESPPESLRRAPSPKPLDLANGLLQQLNPASRILSSASTNGTPRSSGEIYSMSNNSTETLASEYITQENSGLMHKAIHSGQGSHLAPTKSLIPEMIMMGYAQIAGSFTLDGSLVKQSPFEGAKKKGIISGQGGGGVVRVESTKRDSGLLGSFGWVNLGESLGGLLGSNEFSSIKEAKNSPNARSIPILTTPQSILFVDLRLGPGESRSYSYRHPLPKGIPPSYKGRAIRIAYDLVIGTQRAAKTSQQQQMQHAHIPFRVLTSVNDQGEILGHDLMSPHTILSDIASSSSVENRHVDPRPKAGPIPGKSASSCPDFLSYVGSLLDRPRQSFSAGLLSPTEPDSRSLTPMTEGADTMEDAIDLAIRRSNVATSSKRSVNRFEIARSGERVAVIMLARPAYRLGETIPVTIDLEKSDLQCYSLHATLETSETVDSAIALRSKASIHRVTRRIHASQFETTIAAKKVLFNPMIPLISTPDFITSGIGLEWKLRFEFVTSRIGDAGGVAQGIDDLMDVVARDERGSVRAALQGLTCETFDVTVPIRVYGATAGFDERIEAGEFPI